MTTSVRPTPFDGATQFDGTAWEVDYETMRLDLRVGGCILNVQSGELTCRGRPLVTLPHDDGEEFDGPVSSLLRGDDLVLLYALSDGEAARTGAARLDLAGPRVVWHAAVPSFNVGEAILIEGDVVFQSAMGTLAALDLATGTTVARSDGLYDHTRGGPSAFESFGQPRREGDAVVFPDGADPSLEARLFVPRR